jgi:Holliday junction resolvase RusA-like endonuclease
MSKPLLSLTVDGAPVSQPRPRVTNRGTYMPPEYIAYRDMVGWAARGALGLWEVDAEGRYSLILNFYLKPQKTTKKNPMPDDERKAKKHRNDLEKLAGTVMDALEGVLYYNDEQVDHLLINKWAGRNPRVQIEAWKMP